MSTSNTPRTDKERFTLSNYRGWLVHAEHAEQLETENREMRKLLAEWVSIEPDKCRSDHHGVCYEHSHFDLPCPVARAREILSENREITAEELRTDCQTAGCQSPTRCTNPYHGENDPTLPPR